MLSLQIPLYQQAQVHLHYHLQQILIYLQVAQLAEQLLLHLQHYVLEVIIQPIEQILLRQQAM